VVTVSQDHRLLDAVSDRRFVLAERRLEVWPGGEETA